MKPICPKCGSEDVIMVIWGMPTARAFELAAAGEVGIGGCMVPADAKNSSCRTCGHEFDSDWTDVYPKD